MNRVGWAFGYYDYYNPYAAPTYVDNSTMVYNYSEPLIMTPDETTLSADPQSDLTETPIPEEVLSNFDQARVDFYNEDYEAALKSTDAALKELPNDAVIHEFRALVSFALGNYNEAAATLYAVLSVGPGWDWTTMSGLYPSVDVYTTQLRALESYIRSNPDDQPARFVLAYHYVTAGHDEAAIRQLKELVEANPQDQVSREMLERLDPEAEIPDAAKQVEPPKLTQPVSEDQLVGSWTAKRGDSTFEMTLGADREFSWSYSQSGGEAQKVTGVWGIDDDGVLAMEMNDEGTMLAQVIVKGNSMDFYMLGDTQGQDPLKFEKK
ncbi:tetratricopeptide repeat protein [Thalassoglobus neptunius]|uniref:tetratricopeptide repeat protein n=1 Tax=Thalassoglobus neptunius TaxID=1938619 RepID=UPI0018D236EE|nr:tetratricopeptide repeat protein [Thalassoglobus neptunius]